MDRLAELPPAMRVVLPRLVTMTAGKVAEALRTNLAEFGLSGQEEQGRPFATLRFVEQERRAGGAFPQWSPAMTTPTPSPNVQQSRPRAVCQNTRGSLIRRR